MWIVISVWTILYPLTSWSTTDGWKHNTPLSNSLVSHKKTCIFPSVHRRAAIYECQHSTWSVPNEHFHSRKPIWWCPLTDNFDHYPEWIQCPETDSTYGGNQPGKRCHFPFVYQKESYTACIRSGGELAFDHTDDPVPIDTGQSGYWWCSTTADFDRDGKWTRCRPQLAQQLPCHFSKMSGWAGGMVSGIAYECQAFAGHWICMTELGQLRECPSLSNQLVRSNPRTEGGNSPGRPCHFPFQATLRLLSKQLTWTGPQRKRNFTTCLPGTPNSPLSGVVYPPWIGYWCATTNNFDRDRLWTRCLMESDHLPVSSSIVTSNKAIPRSTESSLAELWTQLAWFQQMSAEERNRLSSRTHAFSPEFEQSLRLVESKRAQWDVAQTEAQTSWWIWLAPFWWATYSVNQTPVTTTPPNQYLTESNIGTQTMDGTSPLSRGFQLPSWVDSWSSAGWLEFGLSMKERWHTLVTNVHMRWYKAWIIAYFTGFASAVGIFLGIILIVLLCLDETKRKQLFHSLCGSKKIKHPISQMNSTIDQSNYVMYSPLGLSNPPKYPYTVADDYCMRAGQRAESVESENSKSSKKVSRADENCMFTDSALWCTLIPNADMLTPNRDSALATLRNGRQQSTERNCETSHGKPDCFRRPESACPCWSVRDLSCLHYQQQLNHALELIVNLIRTNGNHEEIHKSADLQTQLHQLLSSRSLSVTNHRLSGTHMSLVPNKTPSCDCATSNHGILHSTHDNRVLPSAPPPSYEQVTD